MSRLERANELVSAMYAQSQTGDKSIRGAPETVPRYELLW